jgi:hypothetical protein
VVGLRGGTVGVQVPFLLVINITKFTDAPNRQRTDFGYKVHSSLGLNSFTFSSILDDNIDKGMLRFMKFDFKYPFTDVHPWVGKAAFLTCKELHCVREPGPR